MILGIGIDTIEIGRIRDSHQPDMAKSWGKFWR